MSPVSFRVLMKYLPASILEYAEILLKQKTTQPDTPFTTCIPELEASLLQERNQICGKTKYLPMESEKDWDLLNRFFSSELQR